MLPGGSVGMIAPGRRRVTVETNAWEEERPPDIRALTRIGEEERQTLYYCREA